jgi:hypothetical protein
MEINMRKIITRRYRSFRLLVCKITRRRKSAGRTIQKGIAFAD